MKKIKGILSMLILVLSIVTILNPTYVLAANDKTKESKVHTTGEVINEAKDFLDIGRGDADNKIGQENLQKMSNTLYNILLVTGILIALIVGMILGIKFIMGGIEEKAEIKTMIIPYIVGCVVVFGAFTIWKIVVDILQSM